MPGVVQFIGEIESLGHGMWIGVLHDEPVGTSNGVIDGRRLFACPKKHGGFYKGQEVTVEKHAEIAPVTARGTG
jgi:dynactin complex subunit